MFPALFWKLLLAVEISTISRYYYSLLGGDRACPAWSSPFLAPWEQEFSGLPPGPCSALPGLAWPLGLPAAWGAFHCFLECFLNGLRGLAEINLLVSSPLSWWLLCTTALPVPKRGEVFLLHPLDWPVAVTGCWFIHYFAVAPFYLSVLLFFPHADRLNWRVWILPDLWWP